jgi:hypothetical protein
MITATLSVKNAGGRKDQEINLIVLKNKSLIIKQLKQPTYFMDIIKHQKPSEFTENYCFYVHNHLINYNQKLAKGSHFIHFRNTLKGEINRTIIMIADTRILINITNIILTEEIMRLIVSWLNTDSSWIELLA